MLSDKLLRSWIRCRRKAWLDSYGDRSLRNWNVHNSLQLNHQQKSFSALLTSHPGIGLKGCESGHSEVFGLRLQTKISSGYLISAKPPLLQKVSGKSIWGDFAYRPILAKPGKRTTRELRQALALTALLLEPLQRSFVPNGLTVSITNKGLEIEKISLNESLKKQLNISLSKLSEDLKDEIPPPITVDRKKCTLCTWQAICDAKAKAEGHLSEINGIGHRRRQILEELGISRIKDLANSNPIELNRKLITFGNHNQKFANQIIAQAKTQISGKPKRINEAIALPELSLAEGVLIYDIESDPDERQDFLHGFIAIKQKEYGNWDLENAKYHPILMLYHDTEIKRWKRLERKLNYYKNWPILHYGETEVIAIKNISRKQLINKKELFILENRFIDIHLRVKKHWLFPIKSYGLKAIAEWIGFSWGEKKADGARALLWWRQWKGNEIKKKRNNNSLRKIFMYNKDDCIATWKVAEWLLKQDKVKSH